MTPQSKRRAQGGATGEGEAPLAPGLYLVATPIGNAGDITLRALDILARADAIAAEDTRETRKLMEMHGLALDAREIVSYHDRNAAARRPQIEGWLAAGRSVAYCSDAGMPSIADPGYRLVEMAIAGGYPLTAAPGASAVPTALALSGLPSDRFLFAGFLPPRGPARRAALIELAAVPATLVFYESPRRLADTLADMAETLGPRPGAVARELTKRFEEVHRAPLPELARHWAATPARGEVVVLAGPPDPAAALEARAETLDASLVAALRTGTVKDAVRIVSQKLGLPRKQVYARALELTGETED